MKLLILNLQDFLSIQLQLMQMQMLEIMYLGYMFNVDPFDQPQVELYKQETRKILAHE